MSIELSRFCLNRKVAPSLDMETFFDLVKSCGLNKVELRNDLANPSIIDNLTPEQFNQLAKKYDIQIVSINALYPFNLPKARNEFTIKAEQILSLAKEINCQSIIMCPFNEADARSEEQKIADTLDSLQYLTDLFNKYKINGLVEPLGFPQSSLRSHVLTQDLLQKITSSFKIVLDTFHFHLSQVELNNFNKFINIEKIGLVHISGVEDKKAVAQLTDEERIMLSEKDCLKSKLQVDNLEKLGYKGLYSFEPFASEIENWTVDKIKSEILNSIAIIKK